MSDVRIVASPTLSETTADWNLLSNGTLDEREELANYVKVALLSNRRASLDEVLPDPDSTDRMGWWGDLDANAIWGGWNIGCKNWLLSRAKIVDSRSWEGDTVIRAENYTREALQPLVDKRVVSFIEVQAARVDIDRIDVLVVLYRGPSPAVQLLFQDLWRKMVIEPVQSPYGWSV